MSTRPQIVWSESFGMFLIYRNGRWHPMLRDNGEVWELPDDSVELRTPAPQDRPTLAGFDVTHPWRQGRKVGRHIYRVHGAEPSDTDPWLGSFTNPRDAASAVAAVNAVRAGLCGEMDVLRHQLDEARAASADETEHLHEAAIRRVDRHR